MLYSYKATVTSTYDLETFTYYGVVSGDGYEEAASKLERYFKRELDEVTFKLISPDDFIILDEEDIDTYNDLVKVLDENAVW